MSEEKTSSLSNRRTFDAKTNIITHNAADPLQAADTSILLKHLSKGVPVIIPTETVYGLAADATNDKAVSAIYEMKSRPSVNPLIAHVSDSEMAKRYAVVNEAAQMLIDHFWPGPLALVLPHKPESNISSLVTAGLPTLALRCPDKIAIRTLIKDFDKPLAAPSANMSGRTSPTSVKAAIAALDGRATLALDGGQTTIGIESTIVKIDNECVTILRHGVITAEDIEAVINKTVALPETNTTKQKLLAPGMMQRHYAPEKPLHLNVKTARDKQYLIGFGAIEGDQNLSPDGDLMEAAHNLYALLRQADNSGADSIAVAPIPNEGVGLALQDRLRRAAVPEEGDSPSNKGP